MGFFAGRSVGRPPPSGRGQRHAADNPPIVLEAPLKSEAAAETAAPPLVRRLRKATSRRSQQILSRRFPNRAAGSASHAGREATGAGSGTAKARCRARCGCGGRARAGFVPAGCGDDAEPGAGHGGTAPEERSSDGSGAVDQTRTGARPGGAVGIAEASNQARGKLKSLGVDKPYPVKYQVTEEGRRPAVPEDRPPADSSPLVGSARRFRRRRACQGFCGNRSPTSSQFNC